MSTVIAARINLALSTAGAVIFAVVFSYVTLAATDFDIRTRAFVAEKSQERIDALLSRNLAPETASRASALVASASKALQNRLERRLASDGIVAQYHQRTMEALRRDLRIFSGSCFLAFSFAAFLSLFRRGAARQLLPIAIILTLATILAAAWYLFGQDWLLAIILNDYWGWSFAALLSTLTALMIDIAINRARITSAVLNGVASVIGTATYTPC